MLVPIVRTGEQFGKGVEFSNAITARVGQPFRHLQLGIPTILSFKLVWKLSISLLLLRTRTNQLMMSEQKRGTDRAKKFYQCLSPLLCSGLCIVLIVWLVNDVLSGVFGMRTTAVLEILSGL